MGVVAVVQARMGSARLPGKSLMKVCGEIPLLEMVLLRLKKALSLDRIVLATSENYDCDPLEGLARRLGVDVVRGSESDVLSRYVAAVESFGVESLLRVCADNPLVSFEAVDMLSDFFLSNDLDYAENKSPESGFPDGFGAEMVKGRILPLIAPLSNPRQREHVIDYIIDNPREFNTATMKAPPEFHAPEIKLDIDTAGDLARMRSLCSSLPKSNAPYWTMKEIIQKAKEL